MFANPLIYRPRLAASVSWRPCSSGTWELIGAALEHQGYPVLQTLAGPRVDLMSHVSPIQALALGVRRWPRGRAARAALRRLLETPHGLRNSSTSSRRRWNGRYA